MDKNFKAALVLVIMALLAAPLCLCLFETLIFLFNSLQRHEPATWARLIESLQLTHPPFLSRAYFIVAYSFGAAPTIYAILYTARCIYRKHPFRWKLAYCVTLFFAVFPWFFTLLNGNSFIFFAVFLAATITFIMCLWMGRLLLRSVGTHLTFASHVGGV